MDNTNLSQPLQEKHQSIYDDGNVAKNPQDQPRLSREDTLTISNFENGESETSDYSRQLKTLQADVRDVLSTSIPVTKVFLRAIAVSLFVFFGLNLTFAFTKQPTFWLAIVAILLFVGCSAWAVAHSCINVISKYFNVGERVLTLVFESVRSVIKCQITSLKAKHLDNLTANTLPKVSNILNQVMQGSVVPIINESFKKRVPVLGKYMAKILSKSLLFAASSLLAQVDRKTAEMDPCGNNPEKSLAMRGHGILEGAHTHISDQIAQYGNTIDESLFQAQKFIVFFLRVQLNHIIIPVRIVGIVILTVTFVPSLILYLSLPWYKSTTLEKDRQSSLAQPVDRPQKSPPSANLSPSRVVSRDTSASPPPPAAMESPTISQPYDHSPKPTSSANLQASPSLSAAHSANSPMPTLDGASVHASEEETSTSPRAIPANSTVVPVPEIITYRVSGIQTGDFLNMRQGPGSNQPVVLRIQSGVDGIVLVGQPALNGTTKWQKIQVQGETGWVNADFLVLASSSVAPTPNPPSGSGSSAPLSPNDWPNVNVRSNDGPVKVYPNQNPNMR